MSSSYAPWCVDIYTSTVNFCITAKFKTLGVHIIHRCTFYLSLYVICRNIKCIIQSYIQCCTFLGSVAALRRLRRSWITSMRYVDDLMTTSSTGSVTGQLADTISPRCYTNHNVFTPCPRKKQATLIFSITSPSVEIFLQFLKHFVKE